LRQYRAIRDDPTAHREMVFAHVRAKLARRRASSST
jgi:hypothetical protein